METITRKSAERAKRVINEEEVTASVAKFSDRVREDSESFRTSAHLLDDGVIDPRDTRDVLGMCLEVVGLETIESSPVFSGLARL